MTRGLSRRTGLQVFAVCVWTVAVCFAGLSLFMLVVYPGDGLEENIGRLVALALSGVIAAYGWMLWKDGRR